MDPVGVIDEKPQQQHAKGSEESFKPNEVVAATSASTNEHQQPQQQQQQLIEDSGTNEQPQQQQQQHVEDTKPNMVIAATSATTKDDEEIHDTTTAPTDPPHEDGSPKYNMRGRWHNFDHAPKVKKLFHDASQLYLSGNIKGAMNAYEMILRTTPKDVLSMEMDHVANWSLAMCHRTLADNRALPYAKYCLEISPILYGRHSSRHVTDLQTVSTCYRDLKEPKLGFRYLYEAMTILEECKELESLDCGATLQCLGRLEKDMHRPHKSIEYLLRAEAVLVKYSDDDHYRAIITDIAVCYDSLSDMDKSIAYFEKALEVTIVVANIYCFSDQ
jgi:tetratricopeptide (TPR) repeat protein